MTVCNFVQERKEYCWEDIFIKVCWSFKEKSLSACLEMCFMKNLIWKYFKEYRVVSYWYKSHTEMNFFFGSFYIKLIAACHIHWWFNNSSKWRTEVTVWGIFLSSVCSCEIINLSFWSWWKPVAGQNILYGLNGNIVSVTTSILLWTDNILY